MAQVADNSPLLHHVHRPGHSAAKRRLVRRSHLALTVAMGLPPTACHPHLFTSSTYPSHSSPPSVWAGFVMCWIGVLGMLLSVSWRLFGANVCRHGHLNRLLPSIHLHTPQLIARFPRHRSQNHSCTTPTRVAPQGPERSRLKSPRRTTNIPSIPLSIPTRRPKA